MTEHIYCSKMLYSMQYCIDHILLLNSTQISSLKCLFLAMSCDASVSLLDQILVLWPQTQPMKESYACNPATETNTILISVTQTEVMQLFCSSTKATKLKNVKGKSKMQPRTGYKGPEGKQM